MLQTTARDDEVIEYVTSLIESSFLPPIPESLHQTTGRRLLRGKALSSELDIAIHDPTEGVINVAVPIIPRKQGFTPYELARSIGLSPRNLIIFPSPSTSRPLGLLGPLKKGNQIYLLINTPKHLTENNKGIVSDKFFTSCTVNIDSSKKRGKS
jgi:hypothetical protein